jgi:hypothetical protein
MESLYIIKIASSLRSSSRSSFLSFLLIINSCAKLLEVSLSFFRNSLVTKFRLIVDCKSMSYFVRKLELIFSPSTKKHYLDILLY